MCVCRGSAVVERYAGSSVGDVGCVVVVWDDMELYSCDDGSGVTVQGSLSEWLRRWTRNPLGSARAGSNPAAVVLYVGAIVLVLTREAAIT